MTTVSLRREGGPRPEDINQFDFDATIEALRYAGGSQDILTGDRDTYTIQGVRPGEYILEVISIDMDMSNPAAMMEMASNPPIPQRQPVLVKADEPAIFDIVLGPIALLFQFFDFFLQYLDLFL